MAVTADLTATGSARPSPRAVLFDATGSRSTTEDTRIKAFHHLLYYMDFGDPSSGNWGDGDFGHAGAISGRSRNEHFGPIGAHVYEVADGAGDTNFTATVYVTDGVTVHSSQETITVYDPNGANGYSSTLVVSTSGTFTGKPTGATELTSSDYDAALNTTANVDNQGGAATHTRILFRRGETFGCSTSANFLVNGPIHVGAFGTGAAPIVDVTANVIVNLVGDYNENLAPLNNYSFADLEIDGNGSGTSTMGFSGYEEFNGYLILRCNVHDCFNGAQFASNFLDHAGITEKPIYNGIFIIDSTIKDGVGGGGGNLIFIAAKNFAILGSLLSNSASVEHVFRTGYVNPGVFANNYMLTPATAKHVIKMHCAVANPVVATAGGVTQFAYLHNNKFKGATGSAWIVALGPQSGAGESGGDEQIQDVIVDGCWFEPEAATQRPLLIWADRVTVRNNLFMLTGTLSHVGVEIDVRGDEGIHDDCEIYYNTFYHSDAAQMLPIRIFTGSGHLVYNNLAYAPASTSRDMINSSGATITESNNTTDAGILSTDPVFAGSNGDGTGTFTDPDHFKILTSSPSKAAGTPVTTLADAYLRSIVDISTPSQGFYQFTEGEYPWEGSPAPGSGFDPSWAIFANPQGVLS